jgi:hypothetical protein
MSNAHTPGPWVLEIRKGLGESCRDATVAEIGTPGKYRGNVAYLQSAEHIDGIAKDELIANARLIAAAPDMMEALLEALDREYNPFEPDNQSSRYKRWSIVIAKAEGRS